MKIKDIATLVNSKLKVRKLRTSITIITASILFGVVITVLLIAKGFFNGVTEFAKSTFGDEAILFIDFQTGGTDTPATQTEAIRLYNESSAENKEYPVITPTPIHGLNPEPYLDNSNPFAIAAVSKIRTEQNNQAQASVSKLIEPFQGKTVGITEIYNANNALFIENLTPEEDSGSMSNSLSYASSPG
ncbi:MAG: hypothetical protein LBT19_00825 [Candidatus Nomurabacteria bacterium]|jgi:hypothetical protein|nr:hypothetical protein [Candidatus Nomurabacteria bacterium]